MAIIPILPSVTNNLTEELPPGDPQSKDWVMVKSMMGMARKKPQHGLVPIELEPITRKTKLTLVMVPEWGVYFPPYNLSRLAGVTRAAGYATKVHDINVKAWRRMKETAPIDYWDPSREWMWPSNLYMKEIHQYLEPILQEYVDLIVSEQPDVVGFCLYYTNEIPTNWMAVKLRKLLPNAKIIIGGPQAASPSRFTPNFYDHIVQGEGEQLLLNLLDGIENNNPITDKYLVAPKTRLDLDSLPFPDYSYYDLNDYEMPNGISSELSRGCVAKCVFCTEVHFWKYRGRMAGTVLDEVEFQFKTHGIDFVWFIDSLVNGNLKELRAFALGVVERKLNIRWQGYARCDLRMDLDYFKDLKASGCHQLNYGVESGSQRVLDDMKKGVTVQGIEDNLKYGGIVGIENSTNWIIGFPSEDPQGFADTLTLVWRVRNYRLFNVSPGITMMLSPGAEVTMNGEKFNIFPHRFQSSWTTSDLTNTKLHRLIRQKSFLIFLQHLNTKDYVWGTERPSLKTMFDITYDTNNIVDQIPYEEFDYNIIKSGISVFADSAMNEIWPLLRNLWRALGAYTIEVRYEPEADLREWGDRLGCNYTAKHNFTIDSEGNWTAEHYYNFVQQPDNEGYTWDNYSFEYTWNGTGTWL
jgi:hypothetical protein